MVVISRTYAERLAGIIGEIDFDVLSPSDVAVTKRCLLDFLGAAIGGRDEDSSRTVIDWVAETGGRGESPVFLSGLMVPAHQAAFANGTMAHTIELDDVNAHCLGHPAVAVIPAVLAVGAAVGATGRTVLTAILSGYEVMGRLGMYLTEDHYRNWHATSTIGSFGATAGVAKVWGLTDAQLTHALGIAGSFASGLREAFVGGTSCKHIHAGRAAQNGVVSCALARRGMTGPATILDGQMGIQAAMTTRTNPEALFKPRDAVYEIHHTEFKPYASCRSAHTSVDCMLNLRRGRGIEPDQVERIDIHTTSIICGDPSWNCLDPQNSLAARLSIPYNAAAALLDNACTMAQFTPQRVASSDVGALLAKIRLIPDARIDGFYPEVSGARVALVLSDGRTIEEEVLHPKGHPQYPLSDGDLHEKFMSLAVTQLAPASARRVAERVGQLEECPDIRQLLDLIAPQTIKSTC